VRAQPEILQILQADPQHPYDVTPARAKQAQARVACQLSALAPRMRVLQEALSSGGDKVNFLVDPVALLKTYRDVLGSSFAGTWNAPTEKNNSLRVLRTYFPKDEGGVDSGQRGQLSIAQLIPTPFIPPFLQALGGEIGERLRQIYITPFIYFGTK